MAKLIKLKIDVTKIDKTRLYKGKKGTYLNADLWIEDEPDQYGNDGSICMEQSKEERETKQPRIYIGNASKMFGWGDTQPAPKVNGQASSQAPTVDEEDVPF